MNPVKSAVHSRALLVCLLLVAGFSGLSGRLIYLQWIDRDTSARKAAINRTTKEILPGKFGYIVDRNDRIMARNLPVTTVVADKIHLRDPDVAARAVAFAEVVDTRAWIEGSQQERRLLVKRRMHRLREELPVGELLDRYLEHMIPVAARALGIGARQLEEKLRVKLEYVTIAKDLREDEADEIEQTLKDNCIYGFRFEKSVKRWYSVSNLATHTTGFVNHEGVGQCGLERELGSHLKGQDGYQITRKDQSGLVLLTGGGILKPPRSGFDARLTLDLNIQAIVEEELDWGLNEFESNCGAVVMLEPKTGDVLAIASRPHFDLNLRENIDETSMHYAVQGVYEPGSTFKLVSAAAALDLGLMGPRTQTFCHNGYMRIPGSYVKDYKGFGMLSLEEILAKSSNIGSYKIGMRVGTRRYMDYLRRFGFTEKTGISLSGEGAGWTADPANGVNFSRITYGYGVVVTPLQVASAYAAVANDGVRMKPRLVQALLANDGTVVQEYPPETVEQVISSRAAHKMRMALETVVNPLGKGNTGRRAAVPRFLVCGKTGTAHLYEKGVYLTDRYAVSFAGFMPRDDPAFVCVVVVRDPRTEKVVIGGGSVAAPIFQRIAARTATYLNLTPTEPVEETLARREN